MSDLQLQKHFNFEESDLYANRNGSLSKRQAEKRLTDAKNARPGKFGCGFFLLLVASVFPISFGLMLTEEWGNWGAILPVGCVTLIWVIAWGWMGVGSIKGALLPPVMQLASVSGPVNIVGVERRTSGNNARTYTAYELRVGDRKFDVPSIMANTIAQGDAYAIYYIQGTEEILSLEQV